MKKIAVLLVIAMLFSSVPIPLFATTLQTQIPDDAVSFNHHSYKVYNESLEWDIAKVECESLGGHLATITSKEENDFITSLITGGKYHIGGSDVLVEGTWQWVTGETWEWTNWDSRGDKEPNNLRNQDYLMIHADDSSDNAIGSWDDGYSIDSYVVGYVCEWEYSFVDEITFAGHKYKLFDESLSWSAAQEYCNNLGGHLVTITSAEEQSALISLATVSTKKNLWIGAKIDSYGAYSWITGETFEYVNWASGEPNNVHNSQYTAMMYTQKASYSAGLWNDENENGRDWPGYELKDFGFICEWDSCYDVSHQMTEESAALFIGFILNDSTLTEDEIKNSVWYKILTNTYSGNDYDSQVQALITFTINSSGGMANTANDHINFLTDDLINYLEKELSRQSGLSAEIINEYQNNASNKLTEALYDVINYFYPSSADSYFNVSDIYDSYCNVVDTAKKGKVYAERIVMGLEASFLAFEHERAGRYTYFYEYLRMRNTFSSKDDEAFKALMAGNRLLVSDSYWMSEFLNCFTWITGKDSFSNHFDLMDQWAECIHNLRMYNMSRVEKSDTVYIENGGVVSVNEYKGNDSVVKIDKQISYKNVERVNDFAFSDNKNLESVVIPSSLKKVGFDAFFGCDNLTDVYYEGSQEEWNNIVIKSGNDSLLNAVIHFDCNLTLNNKSSLEIRSGCVFNSILGSYAKDIISNFEYSDEVNVVDNSGKEIDSDEFIRTGYRVQRIINGIIVYESFVVVNGDTDGDGYMTVADCQNAYSCLMNTAPITGAYAEAANTDGDDRLSIIDIMKIFNMIIEPSSIQPGWTCNFGVENYSSLHCIDSVDESGYTEFVFNDSLDPYFYPGTTANNLSSGGTSGSINATQDKIAVIRYKTNTAGSLMFYFGESNITGHQGFYSDRFSFVNDDRWHDLYIDMSSYSGWNGRINALRVDLDGFTTGDSICISFIAFFDTVDNARKWASDTNEMVTDAWIDTSEMKGNILVSGGSNSTSDYADTTDSMRFYRSNLSQYLKIDGTTTDMMFSYSDVSAKHVIKLADGTEGYVVPSVAVYNSSDTVAFQNNKDGAIQWTYIPDGGSGTVNFQSDSTVAVGSYYDQDVKWDGYTSDLAASDAAVEKGVDKYVYHGAFSNQVLPAGSYKAKIVYNVLFPSYVKCQVRGMSTVDGIPYDGSNMRMWPSASANYTSAGNVISDTDGLITSVPDGTAIYVGFDKNDTSTAKYYPSITGSYATTIPSESQSDLNLYGGWFNTGSVHYSYKHIWRMASCVINGVFYEGWIDLYYTNFWDKVAVNDNTDADIIDTSSASAADLAMVPRKYRDFSNESIFGEWVPYTYVADSSDEFEVRWSWTFDSEENVESFTKDYDGNTNAYYTNAEVEYNDNKYVTLTSTVSTSQEPMSMGHVFTSSITRTGAYWNSGTVISPAETGLCQVNYYDPLNADNQPTAFLCIVYRSLDSIDATNVIEVCMNERAQQVGASDSVASGTIICDGSWRTLVIDLSTLRPWTQVFDPDNYDGLRLAELSYMTLNFFGSENNDAGKSIDLAAIGIFETSDEASAFGTNYASNFLF